eukprot:10636155-Lingulodinium_polyedra.AAC.1
MMKRVRYIECANKSCYDVYDVLDYVCHVVATPHQPPTTANNRQPSTWGHRVGGGWRLLVGVGGCWWLL